MVATSAHDRTRREGTLLGGKYLLEKRLGVGGMGEVWRARNVAIDRLVAIKILRAEHAASTDLAERFMREARAANLVRHRNIVDVLDVGQDDSGAPYMVQELLEGGDLASYIAGLERRLTVAQGMAIFVPIVEAVAYAHSRGVVHRDLKPDNVFLAREGDTIVPKLLDFGISHVVTDSGPRMTATGVVMGTPAYMAPEQIEGMRLVDPRTDVWALGVILHEIFSGMLPFKGETAAALFVQIATAVPMPLHKAAPHVPIGIERIVDRCLMRAQEERFANAGELLKALRAVPGMVGAADAASRPDDRASEGRLPTPRELAPTVASAGGSGNLEVEQVGAAQPPRPRQAPPPARLARVRRLRTTIGGLDQGRVLAGLGCLAGAFAGDGVLTLLNQWPEGWAVAPLASAVLGAVPALVLSGLLVAAGLGAGVRGWRHEPKSPGHFIAAAGWLVFAVVVGIDQNPHSHALAWAAAFASFGGAAACLRRATDRWLEDDRPAAGALVAAAALALFMAAQFLRAAG